MQNSSASRSRSRGRKRSFDETYPEEKGEDANPDATGAPGHRRKRSRDSVAENGHDSSPASIEKSEGDVSTPPAQAHNTDEATGKILSPQKKRSRDQLDKDEPSQQEGTPAGEESVAEKAGKTVEREVKRHRDDSQERDSAADAKVRLQPRFDKNMHC